MSLNIPGRALDVADAVILRINFSKLGPRQRTSMLKMAKSGLVNYPATISGDIAKGIRASLNLPYLSYRGAWSAIQWKNLTTDEHFKPLQTALIMEKMLPTDERQPGWQGEYRTREQDKLAGVLTAKIKDYNGYFPMSQQTKKTLSKTDFGSTTELDQILDNIKSGVMTHLELQLYGDTYD